MSKDHTSYERGSLLKQCKENPQHSSWQMVVVNNVSDKDSGRYGSGNDNGDGEAGGRNSDSDDDGGSGNCAGDYNTCNGGPSPFQILSSYFLNKLKLISRADY